MRFFMPPLLALAVLCCGAAGDDQKPQRIVFVGDSITDGNTYPLLVRQALAEAGKPVPVCINAGIGADTARGMRQRLGRDVLVHHPTLVTFSAGINDVLHKVKPADYEADVTAVAEELKKRHIPLIILTTSVLGPKLAEADRRLAEYNRILHTIARKYGCRVAPVHELMQEARKAGKQLLETDQVHPNFAGHRLMARAVLDALGYPKVPVPRELKVGLLPGVVRTWKVRAAPTKALPLDEKTVAALAPDGSWKTLTLPEKEPQKTWWLDQERRRGFSLSLEQAAGPAKSYQGLAILEEKEPRRVYFNTGAHLQTIWLNGQRIYKNEGWTGWHAGKERVPAQLRAGRNVLVIETGPAFFLSITPDNTW